MEVKSFSVKGTKVEIAVNSDGIFQARVHGEWLQADRLVDLERIARKAAAKASVPVSVPFTLLGVELKKEKYQRDHWIAGFGARNGVATGIHTRNGSILVRWEDGTTEQVTRYQNGSKSIVRPLTPAQAAKWSALKRAAVESSDTCAEFERALRLVNEGGLPIDLDDLVIAAQKLAADDPRENDDGDDPR